MSRTMNFTIYDDPDGKYIRERVHGYAKNDGRKAGDDLATILAHIALRANPSNPRETVNSIATRAIELLHTDNHTQKYLRP